METIPDHVDNALKKYRIYWTTNPPVHSEKLTRLADFMATHYTELVRAQLIGKADNLSEYVANHLAQFRKQDLCRMSAAVTDPAFFDR